MGTKYATYAATSLERALERVGTSYPAGWCLRFCLSELYGAPGIGDWDGDGAADAEDYAKAARAADQLHPIEDTDAIPVGALVLWTGGRHDHGHAAYSLGGGEIVSTDLPTSGRIGRVPVTDPARKWGLTPAGYVLTAPTGHKLTKKGMQDPAPKTTAYRVTARGGLRGRSGPSTRTRTLRVQPHGAIIHAAELVKGGGYTWAVTPDGVHYATRFLAPAA